MKKPHHILLTALTACLLLGACASPPATGPTLRFIGHYDVPGGTDLSAQGMPGVPYGGISGIDYDPDRGIFYMISDDRSQKGPARYLTARIDADTGGIHGFTLLSAISLRDADGQSFPRSGPGSPAVDPESIRFDRKKGSLLWTSEGDPAAGGDPLLLESAPDGRLRASLPLPAAWRFDPAGQRGPRPNMVLEGLALLPDGSLFLSLEAPLVEDGPIATPEHGALTRLTRLSREGRVLAQYAYPLDAIPRRPAGRFADNGISEIALLDEKQLLVLERAGIQGEDGRFDFDVRLYLADLTAGGDVAGVPALAGGSAVRPVAKRLLFASSQLPRGLSPDNLEGIAIFPDAATGRCLLLLASDDNFDPRQHNRLLLFTLDGISGCG